MDLNRAYAGSAFTDYYGAQNPYYTMSYPANYSRPAFGVNAGGYDVHAAGGPGIASCTSTFSQTAAVPKPYVTEPLQTAPPPWPTFPSTWDPSKMEGLNLRIPEGAQGILAGAPQKRKRKTTPSQRLAANIRERRRMCNLNTAFDRLRRRVPAFPHEKRLSRIQTLRLSIMYISFMTEMLSGQDIRTIMKSRNIDPTKPIVWQPYGNDENGGGSFVA